MNTPRQSLLYDIRCEHFKISTTWTCLVIVCTTIIIIVITITIRIIPCEIKYLRFRSEQRIEFIPLYVLCQLFMQIQWILTKHLFR